MKKLKQLLVKSILFTIVLSMFICTCAFADAEWQNVYTEDFSQLTDSDFTNANYPELKKGYSVKTVNEELQIKSEPSCQWTVKDTSYPASSANGVDGINIFSGTVAAKLKKHDTPFVADGVSYDYTGTATTMWAIENLGGRDAIRLLAYPDETKVNNAWSYRTNEYRIRIDEGIFAESRRSYEVELDLYFPSGKKPRFVTFNYSKASGTGSVTLQSTELANMPTDTWTTWKFTVNDANFGKWGLFYGSVSANMVITQANYAYSKTATTYIGRIAVKPIETTYTSLEKTIKIPLGIDDVFGNTKTTFDMNLPATERYEGLTMYNSGNNSARVSLANEENVEVAAIQVDSTDDGQSIYAISESGGVEAKQLLYRGEILGRMLTYEMNVDWKANQYTVSIKDYNEPIETNVASYGPFDIANKSKVSGNTLVRTLYIKHNSSSERLMTVLDNIKVDYTEDPDRVNCRADAEALTLELPESGIVTEGFALPTEGENGSSITWESSDTDVISINPEGNACTVTGAATRVTITLTATLDINGVRILKDFDVTVEKNNDQVKAEEDAEAVTLDIPLSGLVIEDFDLPTVGTVNGGAITWASDKTTSISINSDVNKAILNRTNKQEKVVLTATATINGFSATKEFVVIVCENESFLKARADAEAIVLPIPETGRVKDNFTLPSLGTINGSAVTWTTSDAATISISGNTAQVTRFEQNKDVTLTASATLNGFTAKREFHLTSATLRGVNTEIDTVEEVISGGLLSASVDVKYPGKSGKLNFLVTVTNPETGEILARDSFTKNLTNSDQYSTVTCSVSNLPFAAGNEVKYYLWNEKKESFANNAPSPVKELTAEGRGKGVRLNWDASLDDNNSVEYYVVYRDGEYIGTAIEETYLDETAEVGAVYEYTVQGVDTNDRFSTQIDAECTPALGMYYYSFDKKGKGEAVYSDGIDYTQSDSGDAYSWITEVIDANGEECYAATSSNKWVIGKTDKTCIGGDVREMMFEVVYLDTSGNIKMVHNQVIPQGESDSLAYSRKEVTPITAMQGTMKWKTAVFKIENANFRNSGLWSGSDFGFTASSNGKMFIKEIRIIQADLYD